MADLDELKDTKEYYLNIPQKSDAFYLKGLNAIDSVSYTHLTLPTNREV